MHEYYYYTYGINFSSTEIQTPDWQIIDIHLIPVMIADGIKKCLVAVVFQHYAAVFCTRTISCHSR